MKDLEILSKHSVEGFFTVRKYREDTMELVQEIGPFKNAITDIGLNKIGTGSAISYGYIGSGTAPATTSDTNMANFLKVSSSITAGGSDNITVAPYWKQRSVVTRFSGFTSSLNITEVGVGWGNVNAVNSLWSRALTVDALGNPVTITVLVGEILDVTYTMRYYPPTADATYVVAINGVDYTFNTRPATINSSDMYPTGSMSGNAIDSITVFGGPTVLGALTGDPTGYTAAANMSAANPLTYVDNSLSMSYSSVNTISQANVAGGITGMVANTSSGLTFMRTAVQMVISPPIPKDNTKSMTLNFSQSWARY